MKTTQNRRSGLLDNGQLGPFPMHRFKRVDKPTNLITDDVQRIDYRDNAFTKAIHGDYGPAAQAGAPPHLELKYPVTAAQLDSMIPLALARDNEVAVCKAPIPGDPAILTRHIKLLGYYLKADIMGICRIPKYAVYGHNKQGEPIDIDYEFAIVIVMGKHYPTVTASTGNDWIVASLSFQCYQHLCLVSHTIADYIRRLGYPAVAEDTGKAFTKGFDVLLPPLLLWAGMGEVCRAGIILNPYLGPSYKAAVVLTNLPLVPDKPIDFGLQDFCQHCKKCAVACPSKAISMGDKGMYNGYETWKLDAERCAKFFILNKNGAGCGRCVEVCPWTRPNSWNHNLVRWAVQRSSLARRISIKADDILGYGKGDEKEKWWFDLENVDGVLRIPRQRSKRG